MEDDPFIDEVWVPTHLKDNIKPWYDEVKYAAIDILTEGKEYSIILV